MIFDADCMSDTPGWFMYGAWCAATTGGGNAGAVAVSVSEEWVESNAKSTECDCVCVEIVVDSSGCITASNGDGTEVDSTVEVGAL